MNLRDNTILITGGATGIGLALAKKFLELGNTVLICGRDEQKLTETKKQYPTLHTLRCDIRSSEDRSVLAAHVGKNFPNLNVLINNAGIYETYRFDDGQSHLQQIDEDAATNLIAPLQLVDIFIPLLKKQPASAIVNVTSALARVMHDEAPVYCATKAGLEMFTRILRRQLKGSGICVFEIAPPLVDTQMCRDGKGKISPEQLVEEFLSAFAQNRWEVQAGRTKLFYFLNWLHPQLAAKAIGRF